jgi:hypothetical protein
MKNTKQKEESYKIVPFSDMKASFFITEHNNNEKILLRLDEGKHKETIIEITDITCEEEDSSILTFDMTVVYSPNNVSSNDKTLIQIVKKLIKKILEYAILHANDSQLTNITK